MIELYNDDCIKVMRELEDKSIDLVLTDPPYGTTACSWDSVIDLDKMWDTLDNKAKDNAAIVLTASQPYTSILVTSNLRMFRHEWIWIKNRGSNFANTVREPMKEHESIIVFSKGKWTYNKQMQERAEAGKSRSKYNVKYNDTNRETYRKFEKRNENKLSDMRVPSSYQKFNVAAGNEKVKHPTQKPVELMEYLIKTYSNENDTVLDFTMGSGTTGVACKRLNRNFIGIELDKDYYEIAKKRIDETEVKQEKSTSKAKNLNLVEF